MFGQRLREQMAALAVCHEKDVACLIGVQDGRNCLPARIADRRLWQTINLIRIPVRLPVDLGSIERSALSTTIVQGLTPGDPVDRSPNAYLASDG